MLKIEGLKLAPGESEALLYERAAAALRVKAPLHTPVSYTHLRAHETQGDHV